MGGAAIAGGFVEQPHVEVALHQHLVQQSSGEGFGLLAGLLRGALDLLHDAAEARGGFAVLGLAQPQGFALTRQGQAVGFAGQFLG